MWGAIKVISDIIYLLMFYTTSFLNAPKNIIAVVVKAMIIFTSSCLSKW